MKLEWDVDERIVLAIKQGEAGMTKHVRRNRYQLVAIHMYLTETMHNMEDEENVCAI